MATRISLRHRRSQKTIAVGPCREFAMTAGEVGARLPRLEDDDAASGDRWLVGPLEEVLAELREDALRTRDTRFEGLVSRLARAVGAGRD
jgi:hypothetical protein